MEDYREYPRDAAAIERLKELNRRKTEHEKMEDEYIDEEAKYLNEEE